MLLQMAKFHSFLWLSNIPLCVCVCVCVCVCLCVCLHIYDDLAVVNSAAVNIRVLVLFQISVFFFFQIYIQE